MKNMMIHHFCRTYYQCKLTLVWILLRLVALLSTISYIKVQHPKCKTQGHCLKSPLLWLHIEMLFLHQGLQLQWLHGGVEMAEGELEAEAQMAAEEGVEMAEGGRRTRSNLYNLIFCDGSNTNQDGDGNTNQDVAVELNNTQDAPVENMTQDTTV